MKTKLLFLSLFLTVLFLGCEKDESHSANQPQFTQVTGIVDAGELDVSKLVVQNAYSISNLHNNQFSLKVVDSDMPMVATLINNKGEIMMLGRDLVSDGSGVEISATTTAVALVSMYPMLGPAVGDDFAEVKRRILAASDFDNLVSEISKSVSVGANVMDTNNKPLMSVLGRVIDEVCEPLMQLLADEEQTKGLNMYKNPLEVSCQQAIGNSPAQLNMRLWSVSPSYYGKCVYDKTRQPYPIRVYTRSDFGLIDLFNKEDSWGKTMSYSINGQGTYSFSLSWWKGEPKAKADFVFRIFQEMLTIAGAFTGGAVSDIDDALLTFISTSCAGVVDGLDQLFNYLQNTDFSLSNFDDLLTSMMGVIIDGAISVFEYYWHEGMTGWAKKLLSNAIPVYCAAKGGIGLGMRFSAATMAPKEYKFFYYCDADGWVSPSEGFYPTIIGGNNQSGAAGQELPFPLRVEINTKDPNHSVRNSSCVVRFTPMGSDCGSVSREYVVVHNGEIEASVTWRLG